MSSRIFIVSYFEEYDLGLHHGLKLLMVFETSLPGLFCLYSLLEQELNIES